MVVVVRDKGGIAADAGRYEVLGRLPSEMLDQLGLFHPEHQAM